MKLMFTVVCQVLSPLTSIDIFMPSSMSFIILSAPGGSSPPDLAFASFIAASFMLLLSIS